MIFRGRFKGRIGLASALEIALQNDLGGQRVEVLFSFAPTFGESFGRFDRSQALFRVLDGQAKATA